MGLLLFLPYIYKDSSSWDFEREVVDCFMRQYTLRSMKFIGLEIWIFLTALTTGLVVFRLRYEYL